jgi:uncharacterized protein YgbK (DUF1537 family)
VIDDDPTGSQVLADVPVIADWTDAEIDWALESSDSAFVILTNSRSVPESEAVVMNAEIGERLARRSAALGFDLRCVSRSDSTLRGHFPAEVDALIEGLRRGGQRIDGVLLCPAFLQAGRVTIDDVHYVRSSGRLVPVAETEFSHDATFGFTTSNLREWAHARGSDPRSITSISLSTLRDAGPTAVTAQLLGNKAWLTVANAEIESDLDTLVLGLSEAERSGLRLVCRSAPSFLGARSGQDLPHPLQVSDIGRAAGPGLLVVGSHTSLTTRQLERARRTHRIEMVELRVDRLEQPDAEIADGIEALGAALRRGDAGVMTSRDVVRASDGVTDLDVGSRVTSALLRVVAGIPREQPLGWIIAKGGITSSVVATEALNARRARVLGQIFPGLVSVWRLDAGSLRPGVPFVVFPGNVGDENSLAATISRLNSE